MNEFSTLVYIEWVDSQSVEGWVHKGDIKRHGEQILRLIKSFGYLVDETEDYITISAHISHNYVDVPFTIPKCAIKKRLNIEESVIKTFEEA